MSEPAEQLPRSNGSTVPKGLTPWRPGQSGNPTGWNAINAMRAQILKRTKNGEEIIAVIHDIMQTAENDAVRLKAAEMLLDRCYGKPKELPDGNAAPSILNIASLPADKLEMLISLLREASGKSPSSSP